MITTTVLSRAAEKAYDTAYAAYSKAGGKWPRAEDPLVPAYAAVRERMLRIRRMHGLPVTPDDDRQDHEIALKAVTEAACQWGSGQ